MRIYKNALGKTESAIDKIRVCLYYQRYGDNWELFIVSAPLEKKSQIERSVQGLIYFTSDLHFFHENIIKHTNRPFRNFDEMNKELIKKWNEKISFDDDVYILGDFTMKGPALATEILSQLKGKKHLICGNHDGFVSNPAFDRSLFVSVRVYAEVIYSSKQFILFHYPIVEWNGFHKGSIALHGHQHNHADYNYENLQKGIRRYDVGVDANYMSPVSAEDIVIFFQLK